MKRVTWKASTGRIMTAVKIATNGRVKKPNAKNVIK